MKPGLLKILSFALAAAVCMPAAAGVPIQLFKTVGSVAKSTEESTNILPAFARSVEEINAATTGVKGLSNVKRVEAVIKERQLKSVGFDRTPGSEKTKYAAEKVSAGYTIKSPAVEAAPASSEEIKEIESAVNENIAATAGQNLFDAELVNTRNILDILKTKAGRYEEFIKNPSSPDKPVYLSYEGLASVLILQQPREFIAYVKAQTAQKQEVYFNGFIATVLEKTYAKTFPPVNADASGNFYFYSDANIDVNEWYDVLEEFAPDKHGDFIFSKNISLHEFYYNVNTRKIESAYVVYKIPANESQCGPEKRYFRNRYFDWTTEDNHVPAGTEVYKFDPFTMTWRNLAGHVGPAQTFLSPTRGRGKISI